MNAFTLHADWAGFGFDLAPLAGHVGYTGHDASRQRSLMVLGDSIGVQQAELGMSFANKAQHEHSMRLLAVFLGAFFADWPDAGQWLKRTLMLLGRGQDIRPIERGGWLLKLSHSKETGILVARVEARRR